MRCAILVASVALLAFQAQGKRTVLRYTTATTSSTLGGGEVTSVALDSSGNRWFGFYGGISRYDGKTWKTYTPADGLIHPDVSCLAIDPHGRLWIGTQGGVSIFDGVRFRNLRESNGLGADRTYHIAFERDSVAWLGHSATSSLSKALTRCVDTVCGSFGAPEGLPDQFALALAIDRAGRKWIGGRDFGIYEYNDTVFVNHDSLGGVRIRRVDAIAVDARGTVWVGGSTIDPYCRSEGGVWSKVDLTKAGWSNQRVSGFFPAPDSSVYAASWSHQGHIARVKDSSVSSTYLGSLMGIDPDGTFWLNNSPSGVISKLGTTQTRYQPGGLGGDDVTAMAVDPRGQRWFATSAGVTRFDGASWAAFGDKEGVSSGLITIAAAADGGIWVQDGNYNVKRDSAGSFVRRGTAQGGIVRWDFGPDTVLVHTRSAISFLPSGGTSWTAIAGAYPPGREVLAMVVDRSGREWIGTDSGLYEREGDSWVLHRQDNAFRFAGAVKVKGIVVDSSSGLWTMDENGKVARYDQGGWSRPIPTTFSGNSLLVGRDGALWVARDDASVWRLGKNDTTRYDSTDGIRTWNAATFLGIDAAGDIWLGGWAYNHDGLMRLVDDGATTPVAPKAPSRPRLVCLDHGCGRVSIGTQDGELVARDIAGAQVLRVPLQGGVADVRALARGVYQLEIRSTTGASRERFLKP